MTTKTVTVREVFEAIKKNGFQHLREAWFAQDLETGVWGACVLGQAALNLGVAASAEDDYSDEAPNSLYGKLNKFQIPVGSKWQGAWVSRGLGSTIVRWNDAIDHYETDGPVYTLPTYEDVVNMAYEVLEPFFDETIELDTHDWGVNG